MGKIAFPHGRRELRFVPLLPGCTSDPTHFWVQGIVLVLLELKIETSITTEEHIVNIPL